MEKSLLLLLALMPFFFFWKINFKLNGNGCFEFIMRPLSIAFKLGCDMLNMFAKYSCVIPFFLKKIQIGVKFFIHRYCLNFN